MYLASFLSPEGILRFDNGYPIEFNKIGGLLNTDESDAKQFFFDVDAVLIWTMPMGEIHGGYFHFNEMYLEHHFGIFSIPSRPHIFFDQKELRRKKGKVF